jgi:hypothetical protein
MYGIKGKYGILCWTETRGMTFYPESNYNNPVIKESAREIDQLMQDLMSDFDEYSIFVFKFTEKEEADYIVRKLRGY